MLTLRALVFAAVLIAIACPNRTRSLIAKILSPSRFSWLISSRFPPKQMPSLLCLPESGIHHLLGAGDFPTGIMGIIAPALTLRRAQAGRSEKFT